MHYVTRFCVFWLWDDLEHKMLIADDTIDKTDKDLKTKNVAKKMFFISAVSFRGTLVDFV